jgi:ribosomal protein L11 methyltransferase
VSAAARGETAMGADAAGGARHQGGGQALTRWVVVAEPGAEEIVLAQLLHAVPAGLEELADGEFAVYEAPPEIPGVAETRMELVPDGWATRYHEHLGRIVAGRFAVRPPWVDGEPDDLVIDPGAAFGAGTHATTRLCLELLEPGTGPLHDWGAGTGVLSVAAMRSGYDPVLGIDVDTTQLARNGVEALQLDLTADLAPYAPTVVANLPLPALSAAAIRQPRPRRAIVSGFLAGEHPRLWDMQALRRRELDGWAAEVLG